MVAHDGRVRRTQIGLSVTAAAEWSGVLRQSLSSLMAVTAYWPNAVRLEKPNGALPKPMRLASPIDRRTMLSTC
jgi:hypothetical protein